MRQFLVIFGLVCCLLSPWPGKAFAAEPVYQLPPAVDTEPEEETSSEKNPWVAAGLSLLIPGSGQMYVEEDILSNIWITVGLVAGVVLYIVVDQQRAASVMDREIREGQFQRLADARWDVASVVLQLALPSLWIWNFGDAFRRAEQQNRENNPSELPQSGASTKGSLLSVTLWQF